MQSHIKRLEYLGNELRITGLIVLGTTAANILTLVFLFLIYYLNQKFFADTRYQSFATADDLKRLLTSVLFVSSAILIAAFATLYRFEQIKKRVNIMADEIFDEVGWYSRERGIERKKNFSSEDALLSMSDRIAIKTASESTNLPFLTSGQSAVYYIFFNFILFFMSAFTNLYLIQLLTRITSAS